MKNFLRGTNKIVDLVVVLFLMSFLLYGGYIMWDNNSMFLQASSTAYAAYRPVREEEEELGFDELRAINPDVFGWIEVFGTNINYPLVQGTNNQRYTYTNARGNPAMAGAIFLDAENNRDLSDFNNIIYGHEMARGAMFGDIINFEQAHFFEARRFGTIYNGERHYGIEFFAFLLVNAFDYEIYNPLMSEDFQKLNLLERISNEAIQYRELDITLDDRLVILSTCTPAANDGRHILVGRLIDEIPQEALEGAQRGFGVDNLFGFGELGLATGSLLVIIVTVIITLLITKKKKKPKLSKDGEVIPPKKPKKKRKPPTLLEEFLFLFGKVVAIVIIIVLLFTFVFGTTQSNDSSMSPAIREGDIVFFQRIALGEIVTGDMVVVLDDNATQVRRVVAVGGDVVNIYNGALVVNGFIQQEFHIFEETHQFVEGVTFPLVLLEGEVFLLGDSRGRARDSRIYGPVRTNDILGSVVTVIRRRNL